MVGYIGSKASVTQVDGYNQAEANAEFVAKAGDTITGDLSFGDNDKAVFGAGSDLQIYHDDSDGKSYIRETGSGNFEIRASNLRLKDATGGNYLAADADAAVTAYYDGSPKLATTSTGIDVTGTVTATSFSGDGSALTGVGASTDYNAVGTYVVAYVSVQNTTVAGGQTFAGSALRGATRTNSSAGYIAPFNNLEIPTYLQSMGSSGTWRIMQHKSKSTYSSSYYAAALLVRIS